MSQLAWKQMSKQWIKSSDPAMDFSLYDSEKSCTSNQVSVAKQMQKNDKILRPTLNSSRQKYS